MSVFESIEETAETQATNFRQLPISTLDDKHQEALKRSVSRILATELGEITYAQIIDGLPLYSVACDSRPTPQAHHPIKSHPNLCPGVLAKTREFRDSFDAEILEFDSRLLLAFQAAAPGSQVFNMRLIEIIAVAVHQLAIILFKLDSSLHKEDGITESAPPDSDEISGDGHRKGAYLTLFRHPWYKDYKQYPNGLADVVGYWAENRILGGVVLFDRGTGPHCDPDAVYFHSNRKRITYRIYRLLSEQKQVLLNFLTANPAPDQSPLPILGDDNNLDRVDPEEPHGMTKIYRDIWEREDYPPGTYDQRMKDVWYKLDFPTYVGKQQAWKRGIARKERFYASRVESQSPDLELLQLHTRSPPPESESSPPDLKSTPLGH